MSRLNLDELLAQMIDVAESRGLKWIEGAPFMRRGFRSDTYNVDTDCCCAVGALALAVDPERAKIESAYRVVYDYLSSQGVVVGTSCIYTGNDGMTEGPMYDPDTCDLWSLGRAYREAMRE